MRFPWYMALVTILIIFKGVGRIDAPWWVVTAPAWIPAAGLVALGLWGWAALRDAKRRVKWTDKGVKA